MHLHVRFYYLEAKQVEDLVLGFALAQELEDKGHAWGVYSLIQRNRFRMFDILLLLPVARRLFESLSVFWSESQHCPLYGAEDAQ